MTTIAFTGDIAFSKYFKDHYKKDFLDNEIKDFFATSDHVVANVEAPLTEGLVSGTREINHFSNPDSVEWFKGIKADIWTIANNHILDCDEQGMKDTIASANKIGAVTVGAGLNKREALKSVVIEKESGIGIIAVTYKRGEFIRATDDSAGCILFEDAKAIKQAITDVKRKNKWCIVIAHGGDEFSNLPMSYIRKKYHDFLRYGADVVVGHHPHVVQNYETVDKKVVFYSLGNFVFDTDYQRKQKYSEFGILLKLKFDKNNFTWSTLPIKINREEQTVKKALAPDVFCDVTRRDYRLLWPLAAEKFLENFIVAKTFVIPKTLNYTPFEWFKYHTEKIGLKNALIVYAGKYISKLKLWKFSDKKLCRYISQD